MAQVKQRAAMHLLDGTTVLDLFGDIPVTENDIDAWVNANPNAPQHGWRRKSYIKNWDVAGKVSAAKFKGEWPLLTRYYD